MYAFWVFHSLRYTSVSTSVTVRTDHNMDPAAFVPSEELREDFTDSVARLVNLWLNHEGRKFCSAVATATGFRSPQATGFASPTRTEFPPKSIFTPQLLPLTCPARRRMFCLAHRRICGPARHLWCYLARRCHLQWGSGGRAAGVSPLRAAGSGE